MKIGILSRGPQNHSTRRLSETALAAGHAAEILDPFGFYLHIGGNNRCVCPWECLCKYFGNSVVEAGLPPKTPLKTHSTPLECDYGES